MGKYETINVRSKVVNSTKLKLKGKDKCEAAIQLGGVGILLKYGKIY